MTNTDFIPDKKIKLQDKNLVLSHLINAAWFDLEIVSIKRIEQQKPAPSGWEVTFREST
jgi:hypothetical protein